MLSRSGSWRGLLVLNYHRIGSSVGELFDHALWSATARDFSRQVRWLASRFQLIGPDQIETVLSGEIRQAVMLSFDDGYRDNYTAAFPILRDAGVPATFFISTGFIDSPSVPWWDEICWMIRSTRRTELLLPDEFGGVFQIDPVADPDCTVATRTVLRRYKSVPGHRAGAFVQAVAHAAGTGRCPASAASELWMTWDMIREMRDSGMFIGGHTHSHPVLARLAPEEQDREIELCRSRLDAELGTEAATDAFSYPVGGPTAFDEVTRACLQRHGFRWAFSYYGGWQRPGRHDPHDLPRTAIEQEVDLPQFRSMTVFPQMFA
ncbi:MAG: polysaccharide deacetylase family protein [Planctomycetaceae bacterium]|nr:polysaccharide deacetylase family protein [Planctomycetaceae bacterium]